MANQNWLALTRETALEPQLPIIDTHQHFWDGTDRTPERYLLAQLVADAVGHNVRQTVFIECGSMYRADGPDEFRVVGETEFVQGIAAESASGRYGEGVPGHDHRLQSSRWADWGGTVRRAARSGLRGVEACCRGTGAVPERGGQRWAASRW